MPTPLAERRLSTYLAHWWRERVALDGRAWSAFRRLMTNPGRAAADFLDAEEEPGPSPVHPIRLYLTINLIFFLLAPVLNSDRVSVWSIAYQGATGISALAAEALERRVEAFGAEDGVFELILDDRMQAQQGALVILLIPILALATFAVARRRRPFALEHLVLATNLVSFLLVALLVVGCALRLLLGLLPEQAGTIAGLVVILAWLIWIPITFFRSARSFFDGGPVRALVITAALGLACVGGMMIYLQVLFWVSLWGLSDLVLPNSATG